MLELHDLLVARDFSPASDRALRHTLDLAARTEATLHVVYAKVLHQEGAEHEEPPSPTAELDRIQEEMAQKEYVSAEALEAVSIKEVTRRDVAPAPAILRYASETDVDLITLGTHGQRGLKRALLGSVAEEVVRRAERPVLTVRGGEDEEQVQFAGIQRILAPLDFSEHSREALLFAREWAALYGAKLDLLHVIEDELHPIFDLSGVKSIYEIEPNVDEKALAKMGGFLEETPGPSVDIEKHLATGVVSSGITEFVAAHDIDLIIMSSHGRTGLKRFFLGSVSEKVVRYINCPVLTVKAFGKSLVGANGEEGRQGEG